MIGYVKLALARNMIGEHHSARLVLGHTQKRLAELEKAHVGEQGKAEFRAMNDEIESLSKRPETEDPPRVQSADHLVHDWMAKLRGWFGPSA